MLISLACAAGRPHPCGQPSVGAQGPQREAAARSVVTMRHHEPDRAQEAVAAETLSECDWRPALTRGRRRAQRVEEPDSRRYRLIPPQGERAVESGGITEARVQPVGERREVLTLPCEQRLRIRPGAIEQGELHEQL